MPSAAPALVSPIDRLQSPYDRERLEDIGFMTCMTLVLLGNYSQTGHLGGPLASYFRAIAWPMIIQRA